MNCLLNNKVDGKNDFFPRQRIGISPKPLSFTCQFALSLYFSYFSIVVVCISLFSFINIPFCIYKVTHLFIYSEYDATLIIFALAIPKMNVN